MPFTEKLQLIDGGSTLDESIEDHCRCDVCGCCGDGFVFREHTSRFIHMIVCPRCVSDLLEEWDA